MNEKQKIIECYIERVIPQGKISNLHLFDKNSSKGNIFDAQGEISFGKGREFNARFLIRKSSSSATLKHTISTLERSSADDRNNPAIMLLSEYLSPKKQELLRESTFGFIDGVGNAWINTKNLLIDKRGNKPDSTSFRSRTQNIFSDKATLIPRLLFYEDTRGVREISTMLGDLGFSLSPGYVSKVINALIEEHYAKRTKKGIELINKNLFLEDWVSVYKKRRSSLPNEGWYYPSSALEDLAQTIGLKLGKRGALTGHAGVHFIDPYASFDTVDVLVNDKDAIVEILRTIGARQVDRGANINLIKPYYSISAFFGNQEVNGVKIASDIQLYLDLHQQPKRGREAAEHLFQQRILPTIDRNTTDE